ncbi:MAG: type IX secretion system sortase PorU [Bacteroidia bacterium]|nr:type IX secretion system sortase PorU [Bacteroidia bacterium]MDW8158228.1 type IX secretion system sortase PorU [Bacteroidia bacterium]
MKLWWLTLGYFLVGIFPTFSLIQAQGTSPLLEKQEWQPKWLLHKNYVSFASQLWEAPAFEGCLYDELLPTLPYSLVEVSLEKDKLIEIKEIKGDFDEEENPGYSFLVEEIGKRLFSKGNDWYPDSPIQKGPILEIEGFKKQVYYFYPLQIHKSGQKIRKYSHLYWKYSLVKNVNLSFSASKRTYKENSVLAQGQWYKIGITQSGIYKIDRNFLRKLGLDPASINPKNIQIYGNGGGMLPQANHVFRQDDLLENAIYVEGEADGIFHENDYILFYAEGPHLEYYDTTQKRMKHENHLYTDTCYYFLTVGTTPGKRITPKPSLGISSKLEQTTRQYTFHNQDKTNLIKSGRLWVGDIFDFQTTYTYPFTISNAVSGSRVEIRIRVAARSDVPSTFSIVANGINVGSITVDRINSSCYWCTYAQIATGNFSIPAEAVEGNRLNISITYNKRGAAIGWLDFIEIEYEQTLNYGGGQYTFRIFPFTHSSISYRIANTTNLVQLWDVTERLEPVFQLFERQASNLIFTIARSSVARTYVAVDNYSFLAPIALGRVANQNLHGLPAADYLMIVPPAFLPAAEELANFHRKHFKRSVHIVTPEQIYNEFSSGMQDVSAIRDFVKMFYDRAAGDKKLTPKYLLLFGDGSYDPKQKVTKGNFIPSYQARQSLYPPESYTSDDFYGFLEDNEGFWGEKNELFEGDTLRQTHTLDIAIGRLPVNNLREAQLLVQKIINYVTNPRQFGDWRNRVLLIGDYKQNEPNHMREADSHDKNKIRRFRPCLNVDKIYLDSYPVVMLAEGARYPSAKAEMLDRINKGALIVNYTGHGGETGLSNARIFEIPDILQLNNIDKPAFWITATCEFGRYDDPERPTGAEYLLLLENNRGALGLITSVRQVFSQANFVFNQNIYDFLLAQHPQELRPYTLGEVMQNTKNRTWSSAEINTRNFVLLADPAIPLSFPSYNVVLKAINQKPLELSRVDTLRALGKVILEGEIQNSRGELLRDFNGTLRTLVFDKPQRITTLTEKFTYEWQKNILFRGAVTVQGGKFRTEFVVPIDISYEIGNGKISFYAQDSTRDAGGCNENIIICCTEPGAIRRNTPPQVTIKLNDENWVSGSITHPSPLLIAEVQDDEGINTSGLGIGRELTAVLNNDESRPIILNDFYQAKNNSFREGTILYRFPALPEGNYHLRVKVWDVANNSAFAETEFQVRNNSRLVVENVMAYPNPANGLVTFSFNHNQFNVPLIAQLTIFDSKGSRIKEYSDIFLAQSSIEKRFIWDGTDSSGNLVSEGLYYFCLSLKVEGLSDIFRTSRKVIIIR